MTNWVGILIALVIIIVALAVLGRRGQATMGHGPLTRIGGHLNQANAHQPQAAEDSAINLRKDPSLEYEGEVYFFSSIEERDTFTANLTRGQLFLEKTTNSRRAHK